MNLIDNPVIVNTAPELILNVEDVKNLESDLENYFSSFAPFFWRREQREWARLYLTGLFLNIPRKSIEAMVLEMMGDNQNAVRGMQNFNESSWKDAPIIHHLWVEVENTLGDEDGAFLLDGCDFPKEGTESAGVKRQHCGELGKTANCQAGVFVGYASPKGYTLVNHRLYLPSEWINDPEFQQRREKVGMPADIVFKTKNQLAAEMITELQEAEIIRARWVMADEAFGRDTVLLDTITSLGLIYFAEVPLDTHVWRERPLTEIPQWSGTGRKPTQEKLCQGSAPSEKVSDIAASLKPSDWEQCVIKEGSEGPIVADVAAMRVTAVRNGLPDPDIWLVFRFNVAKQELKAFVCSAPSDTPFDKLVWACGIRWTIEMCFRGGKQLVGMGDYEVRGFAGWHHHMTLVMLAFFFLVLACLKLNEISPETTIYQAQDLISEVLWQAIVQQIDRIQLKICKMNYHKRRNKAAKISHRKRRLLLMAS